MFEGETKDADGAVWIESELEGDGVTEEVSVRPSTIGTSFDCENQWWHIWSQPDEFTFVSEFYEIMIKIWLTH